MGRAKHERTRGVAWRGLGWALLELSPDIRDSPKESQRNRRDSTVGQAIYKKSGARFGCSVCGPCRLFRPARASGKRKV
jgi:hypothetical protein